MFVHIPVPGGLPSGERAAAPSEQVFKKVAETAAEALFPCPGPTSRMAAARRRREIHAVFPARTELIILLAFFRIAEHLVGLVDLLKFFLSHFLLRRRVLQIRVILARELAVGIPDRLRGCITRNAQDLVVISIFDAHGCKSNHTCGVCPALPQRCAPRGPLL